VAAAEGRATTAEPVRFVVNDLSAAQQVSVVLVARNAVDRLKVTLAKFGWDEDLRSATTDEEGRATILLRTQGDLKIKVTSAGAGEAPFMLAVWAGDELQPPVESFLVPVKEYDRRGGLVRWGRWIAIGLGGLALLALGLLIGRRERRGGKVT
ncbi:MAG: hypothetical protein HYS05_11685, partial [Acidobacteria bacterium]|nr:hypothetical protein [Acidobacteriota bacterium]